MTKLTMTKLTMTKLTMTNTNLYFFPFSTIRYYHLIA